MTDEELVKRLREAVNGEHDMTPHGADCLQAADRIEALTAENERLERVVKDISDEANLAEQEACMVENDFVKAEKEIEALTAKLAKAVEALHTISGHVVLNNENEEELSESALLARALLAEIEGEKT